MKPLTVAYITSRREPCLSWFFFSLARQIGNCDVQIIVVAHSLDLYWPVAEGLSDRITFTLPKPTIWQGEYRITREDWWAKSNALNTAICLCKTDWIAFVDDRSVLCDGWLDRINDAMEGQYAVCGSYEKRANMKVERGEIVVHGDVIGTDARRSGRYPFDSWYGGHGALPLEWCLAVNGFSEDLCDSLGLEDSMFGKTLLNRGYKVMYDSAMRIIEDRTPGQIDGALRRSDFGESPRDKSHRIVDLLEGACSSQNSYNIRDIRDHVQDGGDFPAPSASPDDWWDGADIATKFDAL